jgi:amino acid adenylation domain-containing protein/non-ribosomal peptide synthase protein (TIGR01720 family)
MKKLIVMTDSNLIGIIDLLEKANTLGFRISFDNDELVVQVQKEKHPDFAFVDVLKDHKHHLKEYFRTHSHNRGNKDIANGINAVDRGKYARIPLSFSQERLWFVDKLQGSLQYHMPWLYRLGANVNVPLLEESFRDVIRRHEVLRTVIHEEDGKGYQLIRSAENWKFFFADEKSIPQNISLSACIDQLQLTPFDLSSDYMIKIWLIKQQHEHVLVGLMHHIASDGWSQDIFMKELTEIYRSKLENRTPALSQLPVQYAEYAIWQRTYLSGEVLAKKLEYWKNKLNGLTPLTLTADFVRPAEQSIRGAVASVFVNRETRDALAALSQQQDTTLFMTMLASFKVLLHRYTGQEDICVGSPIAGRQQHEVEGLIGFFVNTLALRSQVDPHVSFARFLQQVKQVMLEAYEYQDVPFEKIVEVLEVERDMSRHPLFQVLFSLYSAQEKPGQATGAIQMTAETGASVLSKFDLSVDVTDHGNGLSVSITYCTDLYRRETIDRLLGHYRQLLQSIARHPKEQIAFLQLHTERDKYELRHVFNNTTAYYPADKTIVGIFREQVQQSPDAIAVVYEDLQLTYRQLDEHSNRLSNYLRSKGVKREMLVPVIMERSLELVVGLWAIMKAGGAYVPIDPKYPAGRIAELLEDTGARIVLTKSAHRELGKVTEGIELLFLDEMDEVLSKQASTALPDAPGPDQLVYVIYTSGSTGRPKGVMVEHGPLLNKLYWMQEKYSLSPGDVLMQKTPFTFDVSVWELFWPVFSGAKLCLLGAGLEKYSDSLVETIERQQVSVIHFVPSMFHVFLDYLESSDAVRQLKSIRHVFASGEALTTAAVRRFNLLFPHCQLSNQYGPTEGTIEVSYYDCPKENVPDQIPIGKPISNIRLYVLDPQGQDQPVGIPGELHIGGLAVARGYLNRGVLTKEKFIKDAHGRGRLYRTGDLAKWLPDGNIAYLGRTDNQVKLRGYRIELGEIESVLEEQEGISQAVVVIKTDSNEHKQLIAYVTSEDVLDKEAVLAGLRTKLPEYMVPAVLMQLESIPLTTSGKVDRLKLQSLAVKLGSAHNYEAPRNAAEMALVQVYQQLLGADNIGIHDNFFELGGDSIITIQVVSRARRLGYHLQPRDLFLYQTIARLSKVLAERHPQAMVNGEQGMLQGVAGLMPVQQWFFNHNGNNRHVDHYNQSVLIAIDKYVDEEKLAQCVRLLQEQHDALRFIYCQLADGSWQQSYGDHIAHLQVEEINDAGTIHERANYYQQSLDITKGEIMRAVLFKTPACQPHNRLLVIVHHLAIDGVSWRILLEDLEVLLNDKAAFGGGKTSSYRQWRQWLEQYSQSPALLSQKQYWLDAVSEYHPLPVDKGSNEQVSINNIGQCLVALDAERTARLLQEVPKAYHTEINDVLLAALYRSLSEWSGLEKIHIGFEGHGREDLTATIDLSRTVGWFTTMYPVALENSDRSSLLVDIKEQLRKLPAKGIGYSVLKYINKDEALQRRDPWDIVFNYLGQTDNIISKGKASLLEGAGESSGNNIAPSIVQTHKMEINAMVTGGELRISWAYSEVHFDVQTINMLAESYVGILVELIEDCAPVVQQGGKFTPSDYGLTHEITYHELRGFFENSSREDPLDQTVESLYRLSSLQEGMLFHHLYDPSAGAYLQQFSCGIEQLNKSAFRESWQQVIRRHSILRTAFYHDAFSVPVQCVFREVKMPLEEVDCSSMDAQAQKDFIRQYEQNDRLKDFDFAQAPLMRVTLIRLGGQKYHMVWTYHHIILDGWSTPLLMEEFLNIYESLSGNTAVPVQEEDRYEEYIRYLERKIDKQEEERHWKNYLTGLSSGSLLPFVSTAVSRTKGVGEYREQVLNVGAAQSVSVARFARQNRVTVNTVMQGVWAYLLSTYTGQSNVVFGITVSGRPDDLPQMEQRIGMFNNTIPLHANIAGGNIPDWLREIQEQQLRCREFQYTSLTDIQKWTGIAGDLFDSMITFQNYPVSKVVSSREWELQTEGYQINEQSTNYPLSIRILTSDQIFVQFIYRDTLLEKQQAEMIADHFAWVLEQFIAHDEQRLEDLRLLRPDEEKQLLSYNHITTNFAGTSLTVPELFSAQVKVRPNATAIVHGNVSITYSELEQSANRLANHLLSKGAGPDKLIPVCFDKGIDMLIAMLGILKSGAGYVPIDPMQPAERIAYMLKHCEATLVVCGENHATAFAGFEVVLPNVSHQNAEVTGVHIKPGHLAYVLYTSGSTGKPKGVMIEHAGMINYLLNARNLYMDHENADATGSFVHLSYTFDASLTALFVPLISGKKIVVGTGTGTDVFNDKDLLEHAPYDFIKLTPAHLPLLEQANAGTIAKKLVLGGEALQSAQVQFLQKDHVEIINEYGPTEATVGSTVYSFYSDDKNILCGSNGISIGKPIGNTSIYIVDEQLRLVPHGITGEICIGGAQVARGYVHAQDLTQQRFIDNPFGTGKIYRTGDTARWLKNGTIEYIGRRDEQVKVRGFRVEPGEVETILQQAPGIKQAAVVAVNGEDGYKKLVAFIVPGEGYDSSETKNYLQQQLPAYMAPSVIIERENLPLTVNGKVDRKLLQSADLTITSAKQYAAPRNETEHTLVTIWQELLGIERIGIHDNFFELGGHSLLAIRLIAQARRQLNKELDIKDVFDHATIAELAIVLNTQQGPSPIEQAQETPAFTYNGRAYYQLARSQSYWIDSTLENAHKENERLHGIIILVYKISGNVDAHCLERTVNHLLQRHECLHSTFAQIDGKYLMHVVNDYSAKDMFNYHDDHFDSKQSQDNHVFYINEPMDITREFPFRVRLTRLEDGTFMLSIKMHHVVSDSWSNNILIRDLLFTYTAFANDRQPVLPEMKWQYKDIMGRMSHYETNEETADKQYWNERFPVPFKAVPLPIHKGKQQKGPGKLRKHYKFNFPSALLPRLKSIAEAQAATMFVVMQASFKYFLMQQTGRQDVGIGTYIFGREGVEADNAMGNYAKLVFIRTMLNQNDSFADAVKKVAKSNEEMRQRRAFPLHLFMTDQMTVRKSIFEDFLNCTIQYVSDENFFMNESDFATDNMNWQIRPVFTEEIDEATMLMDLELTFHQHDASNMTLNITYNKSEYHLKDVSQFMAGYFAFIEKIIQ